MQDRGFRYVKARNRFERQSAGYLDVFGYADVQLADGAELRPYVGTRNNQLEDIVAEAASGDTPASPTALTLAREIAHLTGDAGRWRIKLMSDAGFDAAVEKAPSRPWMVRRRSFTGSTANWPPSTNT